jgi:hypothetical protein
MILMVVNVKHVDIEDYLNSDVESCDYGRGECGYTSISPLKQAHFRSLETHTSFY